MPLYPCIAILIGLITQAAILSDRKSPAHRAWARLLILMGTISALVGAAIISANFVPQLEEIAVGPTASAFIVCLAALCAVIIFWAKSSPSRASFAIYSMVILLGLIYAGVVMPTRAKTRADHASKLAEVRDQLPADVNLVSMGAVNHRFCFYYGKTIPQIDWPVVASEVPDDVEYFCFDRHAWDTPERRVEGRGRTFTTTLGTLPFAWEEITRVHSDNRTGKNLENYVVIARRISEPKSSIAQNPNDRGMQKSIAR